MHLDRRQACHSPMSPAWKATPRRSARPTRRHGGFAQMLLKDVESWAAAIDRLGSVNNQTERGGSSHSLSRGDLSLMCFASHIFQVLASSSGRRYHYMSHRCAGWCYHAHMFFVAACYILPPGPPNFTLGSDDPQMREVRKLVPPLTWSTSAYKSICEGSESSKISVDSHYMSLPFGISARKSYRLYRLG